MATSTPLFLLRAMAIDFESVFSMEDESIIAIFKKLEEFGIKKFLSASSLEIFSFELLNVYDKSSILDDEKIQLLVSGQSLVIN